MTASGYQKKSLEPTTKNKLPLSAPLSACPILRSRAMSEPSDGPQAQAMKNVEDQLDATNIQIASLVNNVNNYQRTYDADAYSTRALRAAAALKAQQQYNAQMQKAELRKNIVDAENELLQNSRAAYVADVLNHAVDDVQASNVQKIAGLNSDIMTAKRLGTIHSQNLIHTRNTCAYLKQAIVFVCFAIIIVFCSGMQLFNYGLAQYGVGLLVLAFVIVAVAQALQNDNHYRMLYQERVFGHIPDKSERDSKCDPTSEEDDDEGDKSLLDSLKFWASKKEAEVKSLVQKIKTNTLHGGDKCADGASDADADAVS